MAVILLHQAQTHRLLIGSHFSNRGDIIMFQYLLYVKLAIGVITIGRYEN